MSDAKTPPHARTASASRFFKYLGLFESNGWALALHPTARWLYFQLLRKGDKVGWGKGLCIPNVELMTITGVGRASAYEALDSIAAQGLLSIRRGHRGKSRTIILNLGMLEGFPPVDDTETHDVEFDEGVVESGQPDASGGERVRSTGRKQPFESGVESGQPDHILQYPPDPSRPPQPPRAGGLLETIGNHLAVESATPLHALENHIAFNIAIAEAEKVSLRADDLLAELDKSAASQGGWSDITSAPAFAASIVSRLAKRAGKGANGIPGVARALCERGVPSAQTVWAYLKAEGLVEEYDDAKFDALQEALLRECKWDKSLEHLASELKRAKVGYIRRQAREATRDRAAS
jgi:hypothetical protein